MVNNPWFSLLIVGLFSHRVDMLCLFQNRLLRCWYLSILSRLLRSQLIETRSVCSFFYRAHILQWTSSNYIMKIEIVFAEEYFIYCCYWINTRDPLLTHWGRVTHICISNLATIGLDNGFSLGRRQAIIWTNARILLIEPLGTNFSEIWIKIHIFSFKQIYFKLSSVKWQPFCLDLNVLTH